MSTPDVDWCSAVVFVMSAVLVHLAAAGIRWLRALCAKKSQRGEFVAKLAHMEARLEWHCRMSWIFFVVGSLWLVQLTLV